MVPGFVPSCAATACPRLHKTHPKRATSPLWREFPFGADSPRLRAMRSGEEMDQMAPTPTGPAEATLAYAEGFHVEDEILQEARKRGIEWAADPVLPGAGAALCFLATAINARAVVEIGTGCGVSGLWLLRGMRPDGTLTSVDVEVEHQRLARLAFTDAGFTGSRVRLITGHALDV